MYLIGLIGLDTQSAVTFYIYRVGKTYPTRNLVYRSKSMKNPSCTRTLPGSVRPVGPTVLGRQATVPQPVRPLGQTGQIGWCQFWLSTYTPLLFGEFHKPKSKNYPDVHVLHRAYKSKK